MPKKVIIATTSLAGCFGCHMSLLDIDERLLDLIELADFSKSPITDIKKFTQKCDIGLIEGGCCNSDNVNILRMFREYCKTLIALGECAIMGGLPAMRNGIPIKECIDEAYLNGVTVTQNIEHTVPNDSELPILLDRIYPCNEVVKIDYFIPGCPPNANLIWDVLYALITGNNPELPYEFFKYD
jgi:coenzyme F420-reducing hydrogenase gamma subunit